MLIAQLSCSPDFGSMGPLLKHSKQPFQVCYFALPAGTITSELQLQRTLTHGGMPFVSLAASRIRLCNKLGLRHEETCQSARSRQHRSMIVDKQIDFFLANRVDGALVGQPNRASGSPRTAQSSQIDPARVPGAGRSSHSRPD